MSDKSHPGVQIIIGGDDVRYERMSRKVETLLERITTMSERLQAAIDQMTAAVAKLDTVEDSVQEFVMRIPAMIEEAVQQAVASGATEEQLQALTNLGERLSDETDKIAKAVVKNTPADAETPTDPEAPSA